MLVDKRLEPVSQGARLCCRRIKLTGSCALAESVQHLVGHQPGLLEPGEKIFARGQPLDLRIHGNRKGIQEVEPEIAGNEKWRWAFGCHGRSGNGASTGTNR